jgi:putative DNA primase/helicase
VASPETPNDALTTDTRALEVARSAQLSDAGNAEMFVSMFGDLVRFDHARRRWLIWDTHRWKPDDDESVRLMALRSVRARLALATDGSLDSSDRQAIAKWAISSEGRTRLDSLLSIARAMKPVADNGKGWDETPGLLGVPNGIVDLRTGELRPGRPEDRITMQAGAAYDPQAECPRWDQFLSEVFVRHPHLPSYVQRLAGCTLTAEALDDLLIFLKGLGENGKSTLLDHLRLALGEYAVLVGAGVFKSSKYERHTTEVADFELSRLVACEELGDDRLNANRLKALSGGTGTRARRVFENTREFRQTWQLWLTTNGDPRTDSNDWGFWRRVKVIDFAETFNAADEPTLEETLESELPGILRWMVDGAVAYYEHRLGEDPVSVREATAEYRESVDPLQGLLADGTLVEDPDARVETKLAYRAYNVRCNAIGTDLNRRYGEDGFAKLLAGRFAKTRWMSDSVKARGFKGVRISNEMAEILGVVDHVEPGNQGERTT